MNASPPAAATPTPAPPAPGQPRHYPDNGLADYVVHSRYTHFRPDLGRRETFAEAVHRAEAMHREFFAAHLDHRVLGDPAATPADPSEHPLLASVLIGSTAGELLARAFAAVADRHVLPSMRSLQFGGPAILRHHARLFNCAFSLADRVEFFREFFYLLLAGVGCGFSVQREHVALLPPLAPRDPAHPPPVCYHGVVDDIEGWADALDFLVRGHVEGFDVAFDLSRLRSDGHRPLTHALDDAGAVLLRAAGRRLRPIEVYDLCMFVSRAVLSRGARRSAAICLFSPDDDEMARAKTGDWLARNPQRSASNNSAVFVRATADEARFHELFALQQSFGEPGFHFTDHPDYGCNPCGEAGLHPVLSGPFDADTLRLLRASGFHGELPPDARLSGWQMCNLTTINGATLHSDDDFLLACLHATVIGTFQAAYTGFDYLGPVTRCLNALDAPLGVSICGFMDNPGLLFAPRLLARGARLCRAVNQLLAATLGLRPAVRVTCVKPEGTASLLLGAAAGIHPHHARRYFRRVRARRDDPVYRQFCAVNPAMTEPSALRPLTDDVITFPVEAPPRALLRDEVPAVDFLQRVLLVREHWILPSEAASSRSPGLHHNVSHTCSVRPGEWPAVANFIWAHRDRLSGVALLGHDSLRRYPQPPMETVATDHAIARWNALECHPVDYSSVEDDARSDELLDACAPLGCDPPALAAKPS